jgi:hypothetical protein
MLLHHGPCKKSVIICHNGHTSADESTRQQYQYRRSIIPRIPGYTTTYFHSFVCCREANNVIRGHVEYQNIHIIITICRLSTQHGHKGTTTNGPCLR